MYIGGDMPKTKKNRKFSITVNNEIFVKIESMSVKEKRSLSQCINILIEEALNARNTVK
jgi:macrodomain Ter protein organizer (MatP/YcbG family)